MISGKTTLIAHLGYPTEAFKAPMIYNPWFESKGIDAVVVPMGVKPEDYATSLRSIFRFSNIRGALVTMPHKVATVGAGRRGDADRPDRRRLQRDPAATRRQPARRSVRRRRLRSRRPAQGAATARRARAGLGQRRRRLRDRGVARGGRRRAPGALRQPRGGVAGARRKTAQALPGARDRDRLERSGRLRSDRQCDAARHEGRRPAAVRRLAHRRRAPSSARS